MMINKRQPGMSLTEILVVVAVMAILLGISVPTAQHLMQGFESSTGVRSLINAALANARAIAVRRQAYAGVRFQQDGDGNAYMIFMIQDKDATGLAYGFRAVVGRNPMPLPENIGVISNTVTSDADVNNDIGWTNANTFSVVFSPAGKLVTHPVRVRNKDGLADGTDDSNDTVFNTKNNVDAGIGKFYQDDYGVSDKLDLGLEEEDSVQSLILYSKKELNAVSAATRWSGYFQNQKIEFISPYTGELIMEYREESP